MSPSSPPVRMQDLMTEDEWQSRVVAYAVLKQCLVWHADDPIRNEAGLPDLVIVGWSGMVLAELKREKGYRIRPKQKPWLERRSAGVYLWRPSDWPEVQEVINAIARRPSSASTSAGMLFTRNSPPPRTSP